MIATRAGIRTAVALAAAAGSVIAWTCGPPARAGAGVAGRREYDAMYGRVVRGLATVIENQVCAQATATADMKELCAALDGIRHSLEANRRSREYVQGFIDGRYSHGGGEGHGILRPV